MVALPATQITGRAPVTHGRAAPRVIRSGWAPPAPRVIASGVHYPAATRGDALRVKLSGIEQPSLHAVGTLPGLAVLAAAGLNGPGTGRLKATGDGTLLAWRAPGSAVFGDAAKVTADGTCILTDGENPDKWLRVQVYFSFIAAGPNETRVLLGDVYENGVSNDDVTAAEASAGLVETYTMQLANDSAFILSQVRAWIEPGVAGLEISADGAAWVFLNTEANPLALADIPAGGNITFYVRRTIAAGASADARILSQFSFSFSGL